MARLNVTLDDEYAARLSAMAQRMHVNEGTLARSLLSTAIDGLDVGATNLVELLDRIPGAWEAAEEGRAQLARGEGRPASEFVDAVERQL